MMHRLALEHNESAEDLLALAIKIVAVPSARTIENLTHLAEACKSYSRANPISDERIQRTLTPDFIQRVIIPEICDHIARAHIEAVMEDAIIEVWGEEHPNTGGQIPENVRQTIAYLRNDDSQTSNQSWAQAREIEREWATKLGWYQGEYDDVVMPMTHILLARIDEDVRIRPREYANEVHE